MITLDSDVAEFSYCLIISSDTAPIFNADSLPKFVIVLKSDFCYRLKYRYISGCDTEFCLEVNVSCKELNE